MTNLRSIVRLSAVASLAAIVGCQVAAPTKNPVADGSQVTTRNSGITGAGTNTTGGTAIANGAATGNKTGGTTTVTTKVGETAPAVPVEPLPTRLQALSKVAPMSITAADGGLYRSADGTFEAIIPPGALSTDADVRFAAVDPGLIKDSPLVTPGIIFAMDLGNAKLVAGAGITVKSKVDPRFVADVLKSAPDVDPATRGLSKDASGTWYLTMPVKGQGGATPEKLQEHQLAGGAATAEIMPPTTGYALSAVGDPPATGTLTPIMTGDSTIDSLPAMPIALAGTYSPLVSMTITALSYSTTVVVRDTVENSLFYTHEYIMCFMHHGWCPNATITGALSDAITFNKAIASNRQPSDALRDRVNTLRSPWDCTSMTNPPLTLNAHATYDSDDTTVAGKPAADATLVVNAGGAVVESGLGSDGTGTFNAGTGVRLAISAYITRPVFSSSAEDDITAIPGFPTIELKVPKFSPMINVTFEGDGGSKLPSTLDLAYTLQDGNGTPDPRTQALTLAGAGTNTASASFRALVPGDAEYQLKFTSATGKEFADIQAPPMNQNFFVHRNGTYNKHIKLTLVSPK